VFAAALAAASVAMSDRDLPAETIHAVKNVGSGNASELATYIVEKGEQVLVLVK
jgi:hypothetical protein